MINCLRRKPPLWAAAPTLRDGQEYQPALCNLIPVRNKSEIKSIT
jgi:hypothetical protein